MAGRKRGIREMEYKVGVISGDGIGPEIVTEAKESSGSDWKDLRTCVPL